MTHSPEIDTPKVDKEIHGPKPVGLQDHDQQKRPNLGPDQGPQNFESLGPKFSVRGSLVRHPYSLTLIFSVRG